MHSASLDSKKNAEGRFFIYAPPILIDVKITPIGLNKSINCAGSL